MATSTSTSSSSPLQCLHTLKAHTGSCHVARYDTKGRYLLTAGSDRTIKLWSASSSSASPIKTYSSGHNHDILTLDITSDNSKFASAGVDKNIVVWDVASSSILRRFNAHTGTVFDVKFAGAPVNTDEGKGAGGNNDGSVLVTGGFDATLRMYDLRAHGAWRPILESKEGKDAIQCLHVRGSTIWTGSVDGVVRMYDVRMGSLTQDTIDGEWTKLPNDLLIRLLTLAYNLIPTHRTNRLIVLFRHILHSPRKHHAIHTSSSRHVRRDTTADVQGTQERKVSVPFRLESV